MAAKKWDERKKDVLRQTWPYYTEGKLSDSDMEKAFNNCILTIKSYASRLGLIQSSPSVDIGFLQGKGVTLEL